VLGFPLHWLEYHKAYRPPINTSTYDAFMGGPHRRALLTALLPSTPSPARSSWQLIVVRLPGIQPHAGTRSHHASTLSY
jgi:hypothetical protein